MDNWTKLLKASLILLCEMTDITVTTVVTQFSTTEIYNKKLAS